MANETITGKIFTLKDPTGTYNRFPRTVMEAVYGLETYLQNQFSALADIYMPIEGITESKPLQEFVYRACPSSIKAKSVSLDRIYGRTLAWNQLIGSTNITSLTMQYDTTTGVFTCVGSSYAESLAEDTSFVAGHKYYMLVNVIKDDGDKRIKEIIAQASGNNNLGIAIDSINGAGIYRAIGTSVNSGPIRLLALYYSESGNIDAQFKCNVCDLTQMFGAGNEPSTVEEFEALYPGYHAYNPGSLISNDAAAIKTVGFNQWDEEWELGVVNTDGTKSGSTTYFRSKNYIPVFPNTEYLFKLTDINIVCFYDANKNHITGSSSASVNRLITTPANAAFALFCNKGTTYNHDICINISDPAKNGTYEPYWKRTLQLGLSTLTGKLNGQGASVVVFPDGMNGVGTDRDAIRADGKTADKTRARVDLGSLDYTYEPITQRFYVALSPAAAPAQVSDVANIISPLYEAVSFSVLYSSSPDMSMALSTAGTLSICNHAYTDPAAFKASLNGVYLDYPLATTETYVLDEPLVLTTKAGTTEERISPNQDGLSAPMVCDMTYDAQPNSDSASAQYALTAGRLLNSHTLWGRDFDGTQDVTGALSNVTNLNSLLYLGASNVGIGQSSPAYKLDVNGTFRATGNATIGGTLGVSGLASLAGGLKLTTTKKIWFDDTHYIELLNGELHTNLPIVSDSYITAGADNE